LIDDVWGSAFSELGFELRGDGEAALPSPAVLTYRPGSGGRDQTDLHFLVASIEGGGCAVAAFVGNDLSV